MILYKKAIIFIPVGSPTMPEVRGAAADFVLAQLRLRFLSSF